MGWGREGLSAGGPKMQLLPSEKRGSLSHRLCQPVR